jgi:ABC-type transporter Mla subunit MlaD
MMEIVLIGVSLVALVLFRLCIDLTDQLNHAKRMAERETEMRQLYEQLADQRGAKLNQMIRKWNRLVDRVNAAGGERILNGTGPAANTLGLTAVDIKRMLQLCHPDRHRNSDLAVEITQKLLALREQIKD